jgi:hypothetical protein
MKQATAPDQIKVTSVYAEIRWLGTFKSLVQICRNFETFLMMPNFLFLKNKRVLFDLEQLLQPLVDFQQQMQTRSHPVQIQCVIGLIRLWETTFNINHPINGKAPEKIDKRIQDLRGAMKIAFTSRFYCRWLPEFKGVHLLERCLILCPQYRSLDVIENWMIFSGQYSTIGNATGEFQNLR